MFKNTFKTTVLLAALGGLIVAIAGLLGGTLAAGTHVAKMGSRALINGLVGAIQRIALLEGELRPVVAMPLSGTHPAALRDDHRDGLLGHADFGRGALCFLDEGAPVIAVLLGVSLDFLDHQATKCRRTAQDFVQA